MPKIVPPSFYNQFNQFMNGNWSPSASMPVGSEIFPDDAEETDVQELSQSLDELMDRQYPAFEPEIICTPNKDYFLPALKVLLFDGRDFYSPNRKEQWRNYELHARCAADASHRAPDETCECGIYGSVNLEEIYGYLPFDSGQSPMMPGHLPTYAYPYLYAPYTPYPPSLDHDDMEPISHREIRPILCLVEPSPDAKCILCRKGWRASHAFISEIVGETISVSDASNLLSITWRRNLDLRRIFHENR